MYIVSLGFWKDCLRMKHFHENLKRKIEKIKLRRVYDNNNKQVALLMSLVHVSCGIGFSFMASYKN